MIEININKNNYMEHQDTAHCEFLLNITFN